MFFCFVSCPPHPKMSVTHTLVHFCPHVLASTETNSSLIVLLFQEKQEDDTPAVTEIVHEDARARLLAGESEPKPKLANTGTPNNSPARIAPAGQSRHGGLKHSDSSFGLHSPDSFNDDVQMMIRKFKADPQLKTNLSESKVVLDPDLIDLTMIPPPMTPDEEGPARIFPGAVSAVSTPPTPFADRQSLEAELQVELY